MELAEGKRTAYLRRVAALEATLADWTPHFKDLERHFSPRRARWSTEQHNKAKPGANTEIINGTPLWAVRVLKSGMMGGHTTPTRPWFRLITPDPDLMEVDSVRRWLYAVEVRMREVFARSNLYNALPSCYGDMGVWGITALGVYSDQRDTIRAYPYLTGSYAVANGPRLSVDTFTRKWRSKVADVVQMFGIDSVSPAVRVKFGNKEYDQPVDVHHLLQPNFGRDPRKADFQHMPWESVYWEAGFPEGNALRTEGFHEMPVLVARWEAEGENAYGSSPTMDALGDAKELQFQERQYALLLEKLADPALNVDPGLKNKVKSSMPGSFNYTAMNAGNAGMAPQYVPNPAALEYTAKRIMDVEQRIQRMLYVDMFLMLAESDRRQITAREVEERHGEKLLMLGPVLERLADELLDPLIQRTFNIMLRDGMIPEWPEELDEQKIKIEYISILAQAQKAVSRGGIESVAAFAGSLAAFDPEAVDKLDADQAIDEYAQAVGAAPTIVRSDEAVAARRAQRQKMQAATQMAQMAQMAGGAAKDFAQAGQAMAAE